MSTHEQDFVVSVVLALILQALDLRRELLPLCRCIWTGRRRLVRIRSVDETEVGRSLGCALALSPFRFHSILVRSYIVKR